MLYQEYLTKKKLYQEIGHTFLLERKHAYLFYKPGKGKTYPTIDAIRDIDRAKNYKAKVLILSTADAINNMWNAEIVPQNILPVNTVLISFNSAIVEKTKQQLLQIKWDVIVVDESHKIKSNTSKTSKLVYLLTKKCEYAFGLSGTPRGNNDIDIFCQFHNLNVSEWGNISYSMFVEKCCDIEVQYFRGNQVKTPSGINEQSKAGWERNIAMFTQRVDYTDEDDMPPLNVNTVILPYVPTKEYLLAEEGVIQLSDYESTMTKLSAICKLHQIANGFMYIPDDNLKNKTVHINRNNKLDWLRDNIKQNNVIVYRFEADLMAIKSELNTLKVTYTEIVDDFKAGKADVLLLQCSRCESFNLQMCKRIIFYTLDYSYIKYNQMIHRVWRMGQNEDVQIDVLINENTIEEKIWSTVRRKENLANLFMSIKGA
jgi:SNF2 family DNA or RNA helicase